MKKLIAVIKKDLRLLLRDRGQLMTLFLTPLAFIIPISLAFPKDGYLRTPDFQPPLPVVSYDAAADANGDALVGESAEELLDFLAETFELERDLAATADRLGLGDQVACNDTSPACNELIATMLVERQERETALVIPQDFSANIEAGQRVTMTLLYDPVGDSIQRQINEAVVKGGATSLSIGNQVFAGFDQFENLLTFAPDAVQDSVAAERQIAQTTAAGGETQQQPALSVVSVQPTSFAFEKRPDTYQQTIPGYTVMFVFFLVGFLRATIAMEQNNGTFRRLLSTPASRSQLLAGKMFSALLVGIAQIALMFAIGHFAFGMGLGQAPVALALLTIAVVLAAVGIGLAAAAFHLGAVLSVPLILTALIGGCMFPADWLPQFVRTIAHAVPQFWAMNGYQSIMVRGHGLLEILPSIGMLLLFAFVFFVIAVRRLEFE